MRVAILDYGIGNLFSIARALEAAGAEPVFIGTRAEVSREGRLVVPGVGAFGRCASVLAEHGLDEAIREHAARERPLLGICVGMQLLLETGLEFGTHAGLGLIPGVVEPVPAEGDRGAHKIPHIGWSALERVENGPSWEGGLLTGVEEGSEVYFLHSFTARPERPEHLIARTYYNGCEITAAVGQGHLWGVQFHPEKSGPVGIRMLRNFVSL